MEAQTETSFLSIQNHLFLLRGESFVSKTAFCCVASAEFFKKKKKKWGNIIIVISAFIPAVFGIRRCRLPGIFHESLLWARCDEDEAKRHVGSRLKGVNWMSSEAVEEEWQSGSPPPPSSPNPHSDAGDTVTRAQACQQSAETISNPPPTTTSNTAPPPLGLQMLHMLH